VQLLHSLTAAIAGVSTAFLAVSWVVLRGSSWRAAVGVFFVTNIAFLGLVMGQLIRADATTLGGMELAVRLSQFSALVAMASAVEVFRRTTMASNGRLHQVTVGLAVVCALYAVLSPGGILYGGIEGVDHVVLPWGEQLHVPIHHADPMAPVATLAYALIALRMTQLTRARWRQGAHAQALLMALATLAFGLTIVHALAVAYGVQRGPVQADLAVILVYAAAATQAAAEQRRWTLEREQAIERVRVSEEQLAALVGQGQTLSEILTPEGNLVLANRCSLELIGCKSGQVLGLPFPETPWWQHSSAQQRRVRQSIERAAAGQTDRFQATHPLPDGGEAIIDFTMTPFRDERGVVRWLISEGRDVTELVRFEQRAREEQRLEVIGQLAGGVAHDFNNMLAGILGAAELAQLECEQPQVRESLDVVVSAAERAAALTTQLLAFARRGSNRLEVFSLHAVLTSTLALFQRMAGPSISVVQQLQATSEQIQGDPTLLQSALMNLLVNARDAMSATGGTITLITDNATLSEKDTGRFALPIEPGDYLRLTVQDTGTGIAADVLPRVFEPFYTTKELGKGTGLGLAAVLGCVRDHRGAIDVSSQPGQGTRFVLHLPLATHRVQPSVEPSPRRPSDAGGGLALVVDDEPIVLNTVTQHLRSLGFTVQSAHSGDQALAELRSLGVRPTVALVDLHMRGINGRELALALRESFADLPIVLSSGNFGEWDLTKLRQDAKVRLMAKPARREDLVDALVALGVLHRS
jgi:PAS domain S-box-containing protein